MLAESKLPRPPQLDDDDEYNDDDEDALSSSSSEANENFFDVLDDFESSISPSPHLSIHETREESLQCGMHAMCIEAQDGSKVASDSTRPDAHASQPSRVFKPAAAAASSDCHAPAEHSGDDADASSTTIAEMPASYLGIFLYGTEDSLEENMSKIEKMRPIPGVTLWCEQCERVSILSHTFYRHLRCEVDRCMAEPPSRNEYYTRMCMQADQLLRCQMSCCHDLV